VSRRPKRPAPPSVDPDEWIVEVQAAELARLLDWVRAVDAKVPVLTAISCAIVASVATIAPTADKLTLPTLGVIAAGVVPQFVSLAYCALATFPQTKGPTGSLIFFGGIAERSAEQYRKEVDALTPSKYLADLTAQCHRNAEIARNKYRRVRLATAWLFAGILPWMLAIYILYQG
jgi:hypothetical protein